MAPRTAKAKKNADVKVSENEAPKKGRGKAKNVSEPEEEIPEVINEKVIPVEKKTKRGKNAVVENNDEVKDLPPAKKGRKKVVEEPISDSNSLNGENSNDDEEPTVPSDDNDQNEEHSESNGNSEDIQVSTGKGRKKTNKKETVEKEVKPKETGRGRKNVKQDNVSSAKKEEVDDKPKGRGRGRKVQPKSYKEDTPDIDEEEVKPDPPVSKGRKKALPKVAPEKLQKADEEDDENDELQEEEIEEEEKSVEEVKKKGRKNVDKKPQAKEEFDKDEEMKEEVPAIKNRKGAKKEEKAKGDTKEDVEKEDIIEAKPVKGKRGQKKAVEASEVQDTGEPTTKRRRKDDKVTEDNKKKQKAATDYESLDFSNTSQTPQGKEWNFKIANWNVDGIRAWIGKGGLDYLKHEKPDILCLQEIKCSLDKLPDEVKNIPGYHAYWLCSDKDGYAGVGIYTTKLAMNVQYGLQNEELDSEGRIITAEYEQFYLICTYVPNAGRKLVTLSKRLKWNDEFRKHVNTLDKKKPVIICGDMNVAHNEIDLTNPKTNKKNAGFTEEERSGMTDLLGDGFVDTFRHLYPDKSAYTFWSYMFNSRSKNIGWRLDYFIASERLLPAISDNAIRNDVYGSDHCPITLFLHLTSADKPKE